MSNLNSLSVVAYDANVMGDLSANPKFNGYAHIQSNLAVWGQKDSGVRFPLVCLEGAVAVSDGYIVLVSMHLGELFEVYTQTEDGQFKARHARGAVHIPANAISDVTKSSLDELLRASEEWVSTPVRVTTESIASKLDEVGAELRRWVIRDRSGADTGARFPAISFGSEKAICIVSCEEVQLEQAISGFTTSWQITGFMASGDYRFRLPGAGGSSSVAGVSAQQIDLDSFDARDVDVIADAQATQLQDIPAAPAASATSARSRFVRA